MFYSIEIYSIEKI